jgi:hypothetical protein
MNDVDSESPSGGQDAGPDQGAGTNGGGAGGGAPGAPPKRHRARRTRQIVSWVLIVLAALLIPISVISAWAVTTVTNTDQYVSTMAPLARNQIVVDHLATRATDALFSTKVVQNKVTEVLPPKAKPIVTPIVAQLKSYTYTLALKFFESPKFGQLWDALNRHTHDAVVDILTGKQSALTKRLEQNGAIVVNLSPALTNIINQANSRGITVFNPLKAVLGQSKTALGLTVVSQQQVAKFSGIFNLVVKLGWAVPIAAVLLGVLAVVVAVKRRRALLRAAVGVGIVTLVILAALALGRHVFVNVSSEHNLDSGVAGVVWDTLLRFLKTELRWMLLATLLVAFGAWVAGPARYAVWIRSTVTKGARWVAAQARSLTGKTEEAAVRSERVVHTGEWIQEHLNGLRIVGVIVAGLFLVFNGNLTVWSILVILIVLAAYLGLLQLVAMWARKVAGPVTSAGAT